MTTPHDPSAPIFPRSVTWLGIVILGSALTSFALPPAVAADIAVQSSTIEWPGAQLDNGVLSGGTPVEFTSGMRGWGDAPFSALGTMGLEWETAFNPARRELYGGAASGVSLVPGGVSSWTSSGLLFPRPNDFVDTTSTIRVEANQARWSIQLVAGQEGTMTPYRFFWTAGLIGSYDSRFSSPAPGVMVINDASGQHPTLVLRATSTAGVLEWGGGGIYTAPLASGEKNPTLYIHSTAEQHITVVITLGIVDSDPCQGAEAIAFAGANASASATAWPTLTGCLADPLWVATAGEETTLSIPLDSALPALGVDQVRELSIGGLPEGVTWQRLVDNADKLNILLSASGDVAPGDYALSVGAHTATTAGGVTRKSQPLQSAGTLTIEPAVVVVPEPDPEPEPEPVSEEVFADNEEPESGPAEDSLPETAAVIAPEPQSSGSTPAALRSTPEEEATITRPLRRVTVPDPETLEPAATPFAVARPQETPLFREPPVEPLPRGAEVPPEPTAASAWLGLSLLVSLALGALFAARRRRREQEAQ